MSKIDVNETVRELESGKTPEWITEHLRIYLESGGTEGHMWDGSAAGVPNAIPCLLLTTVGRRSGENRTSPLAYGVVDGVHVIIGSKGGADTHPHWYANLRAKPTVEVQVAQEHFTARARVTTGKERAHIWEQMVKLYPFYGEYQKKTKREIPVVVLEK